MTPPQDRRPAPFLNVPAPVVALMAVIALAHLGRTLVSDAASNDILARFALDPAIYSAAAMRALHVAQPDLLWRIIPLFSHVFLHANWTHLAVNSAGLLIFGTVIARRFRAVGFFAFFFVTGLGGALLYIAMQWGMVAPAIGASGAISGLMGGAFRLIRLNQPWLDSARLPLLPILSGPVVRVTLVWLGLNLVLGLTGFGTGGEMTGIAWQAHMGGYLAGLLLAGPFDGFFGANLRRAS